MAKVSRALAGLIPDESVGPLGEPLIPTERAAEVLGLQPQTLTAYRCEGRGPRYYKIGRRCLYLPSDLREWVQAQRVEPSERRVVNG